MRSKDRQLMVQIKEYVEEYAMKHKGEAPNAVQIGERFNMSRVSGYRYLVAMDQLGMIVYRNGKVITDKLEKVTKRNDLSVNYVEGITAGAPIDAEGLVDEYFTMPDVFVDGQKGRFFTLTVRGDSMVDAGIEEGDVVICRESEVAKPEDIVVAFIPGSGNTLKRYCRDDDGPYLWAENNKWSDQKRDFGREFVIQGLAIKVVKDIC